MRTSEPVRIGMPIRRPNWVSLRPSSALILMPMIEKIVHTAKQTVKAMVDIDSARIGDVFAPAAVKSGFVIPLLRASAREGAVLGQNKKLPTGARASVHLGT